MPIDPNSRRQFLAFLAGSPLLATAGLDADWLASLSGQQQGDALLHAADELARYGKHPVLPQAQPPLIAKAADALDVFDFEAVARQNIPVAHWGYLMTGTDDDATIAANRAGFDRWVLKPRRLIDVSKVDSHLSIFGSRYASPIVVNPLGSQKGFHKDGEVATAKAAKARD
ncbi:alpha-hydroxy-acid oxidizing protein, partial [Gemmatimonas sp.]|uniref:alpha-hydroxy-acid oxidizing protein n=1 Tax=Gemmatimonas sp. TaxID=1962908 RepID=UPI0037BF1DA7